MTEERIYSREEIEGFIKHRQENCISYEIIEGYQSALFQDTILKQLLADLDKAVEALEQIKENPMGITYVRLPSYYQNPAAAISTECFQAEPFSKITATNVLKEIKTK